MAIECERVLPSSATAPANGERQNSSKNSGAYGFGFERYAAVMALSANALTGLSHHVAEQHDEETRWRLLLGFLDEFSQTDAADRSALIATEPGPTGDRKWDVMLAAVAEQTCRDNRGSSAG